MAKTIACNICGLEDARLLFKARDIVHRITDEEFNVVKCRGCGLVYINPQPDDMSMYYPEDYAPHGCEHEKPMKESLRRALLTFYDYPGNGCVKATVAEKIKYFTRYLSIKFKDEYFFYKFPYAKDKKVVDVGCGSGAHLLMLKRLGWDGATQLYGIGYPNEALRRIRDTEGLNLTEGDFMEADMPAGFFDVARLSHVLEHLPDPAAALGRVRDILKPGGKVLLAVPNFRCLEGPYLFKDKWSALEAPRHLFHFTPKTIKMLLKKAGFKVCEVRLKKSSNLFVANLETCGYRVSGPVKKYVLSNVLKFFKVLGFSSMLFCAAVKR